MREIGSYEAKTHFPELLRAVEEGETVVITRHGKPVARLIPDVAPAKEDLHAVIARMRAERDRRAPVTLAEILSARDEGRK